MYYACSGFAPIRNFDLYLFGLDSGDTRKMYSLNIACHLRPAVMRSTDPYRALGHHIHVFFLKDSGNKDIHLKDSICPQPIGKICQRKPVDTGTTIL